MNAYLQNKDFSKVSVKFLKKITSIIGTVFLFILFFVCFEVYVPVNPGSHEVVVFTVQKGWGDNEIAVNLKKLGIIRSSYFFKFYSVLSLKHSVLQAGGYSLSPKMSAHEIANKMAQGDVIRDKVKILEGWNIKDIGKYLEAKGICKQDYFLSLTLSTILPNILIRIRRSFWLRTAAASSMILVASPERCLMT